MRKVLIEKFDDSLIKSELKFDNYPAHTRNEYLERIKNVMTLANDLGHTHVLIYADREHYSNIEYLTKFDPRFEEAILLIDSNFRVKAILGLEGMDYSGIIPYDIETELYESFGLLGQNRGNSRMLSEIFIDFGINENSNIGLIGWKYFNEDEFNNHDDIFDAPHYIVNEILKVSKNIKNATRIMNSNEYGVRHNLDVKELVMAEVASTKSSRKVFNVIDNLKMGVTEIEASKYFNIDGQPLQTHPNVCFGYEHSLYGVASPTFDKKLEYGELIAVGMGYRRSQCHRFGVYARNEDDLVGDMNDIINKLYIPYFRSIVTWYENMRIGISGGEIYSLVSESLGGFEDFGVSLNPGHLIHTDEWSNTIFKENCDVQVRSGMGIQCDMISSMKDSNVGAHIEDGIFIADETLRKELKNSYPESWNRIQARRKYMIEVLGINLHDEVLPLSDIPGVHFPYMADTSLILTIEKGK